MNAAARRSMGAYYTPTDASMWMARWVVDGTTTKILEPSCGDGVFINALLSVSRENGEHVKISAVEKDAPTISKLRYDEDVELIGADFHTIEPFPVDAAIGNPPFVRFRHLVGGEADLAIKAGERALGNTIDSSGSAWMTIVLHAATFIRPGGRLAFVLPTDALYVRYAKPFWKFLASRFSELSLVRCRERIFPEILQDVVVLLADRAGGSTCSIHHKVYSSLDALTAGKEGECSSIGLDAVIGQGKPFTEALLDRASADALAIIRRKTVRADNYLKFNIGYVAGDKEFFHPSTEVSQTYRLPARSLAPTIKNGRQLKQTGLFTSELPSNAVSHLWQPNPNKLTKGELRYIEEGERRGVHRRYKTRIRDHWYCVPGVRKPDVIVPVFGTLPRLIINDAGFIASNSIVSGYWKQAVDPERFALVWYSSITRLGIELSVHALGGGVLVVVPSEADAIQLPPVPDLPVRKALLQKLKSSLTQGDISAAYGVGDAYLMEAGWSETELRSAKVMACSLHDWRVAR